MIRIINIKLFIIAFLICVYGWSIDQPPDYTYIGGWPTNINSDLLKDPGFNLPCPGPIGCECESNSDCNNGNCHVHPKGNYCLPKTGDIIPRFEGIDQFGQSVDLYDFANQGKMTLIQLSTVWCKPCNDLSAWLSINDLSIKKHRWWRDRYLPIRDMINNGDIQLVHILYEGNIKKGSIVPTDVIDWYEKYPSSNIPILADEYKWMHGWIKPTGLPCVLLLDENMKILIYTNRGLNDVFLYLTESNK